MRAMTVFIAVGLTLLLFDIAPDPVARADDRVMCTKAGECTNIATREGQRRRKAIPRRSSALDSRPTATEVDQRVRDANKKFSAALAVYDRRLASYNRCLQTFDPSVNKTGCGSAPTPPDVPRLSSATFSGRGNQPTPTAGQAAAIAVARLQLPSIPPGIGPSPDINPWNMAAVGYPLWLWADGTTNVGPISDSVAGLSVSLEAEVSSLAFRMGDGNTVRCAGSGHPWTAAVQPGTKSPSCGYSYAKPSLPGRTYTVTAAANWAVTWTSNGQSGVINVPAVDTTELPVGELQVLVR
ncbi:MAG TPA: hypothetical protein VJ820_07555 [Propionibacteriaceae bacterium]|nr:hypothetical protein [Propionibacteriaceae bacterium]